MSEKVESVSETIDTPDHESLTAFDIQSLPKVSLHDHLDGGLRPDTMIELAEKIGYKLPTTDPDELAQWYLDAASSGSLERYLETFDHTLALMQSEENLKRIAREFVEDLADDGVVYAEIRWAPEQHLREGLTLDQAVDAVQAGLDEGVTNVIAAGGFLQVGQLITAMRHADNALEIAELAVRHRSDGAVGFDIAGAENGFPPSRFAEAFTYLANHMFPVTVHAGEADGLESIRSAIVDGRALRLGHGVRIIEDIDVEIEQEPGEEPVRLLTLGEVASWVRDRAIALEVAPSSNLQTAAASVDGGTDLSSHPIDLLYRGGFNVTVNTDNRLVSGVTLTSEFEDLIDTFGYDLDDVLQFTLNAVDASFLPVDEREALALYIVDQFADAAMDYEAASPNGLEAAEDEGEDN